VVVFKHLTYVVVVFKHLTWRGGVQAPDMAWWCLSKEWHKVAGLGVHRSHSGGR